MIVERQVGIFFSAIL